MMKPLFRATENAVELLAWPEHCHNRHSSPSFKYPKKARRSLQRRGMLECTYICFEIAKKQVKSFCMRVRRQNNMGYIRENTCFKAPSEESKIDTAFLREALPKSPFFTEDLEHSNICCKGNTAWWRQSDFWKMEKAIAWHWSTNQQEYEGWWSPQRECVWTLTRRTLYMEKTVMHIRVHLKWPRLSWLDCRTNSARSLYQRSLQAAPTQHLKLHNLCGLAFI